MQIVIVAPCLSPSLPSLPPLRAKAGICTTPPQLAMHLAASTPVRHRVTIVDGTNHARLGATMPADLYVLLWSHAFSPAMIDVALQLTACEPLICLWDGPMPAPIDYLLEFCDQVVCTAHGAHWQQLLATVEAEQHQLA
jgi:hypothetical protein